MYKWNTQKYLFVHDHRMRPSWSLRLLGIGGWRVRTLHYRRNSFGRGFPSFCARSFVFFSISLTIGSHWCAASSQRHFGNWTLVCEGEVATSIYLKLQTTFVLEMTAAMQPGDLQGPQGIPILVYVCSPQKKSACMRACVFVCVRVCVRMCACTFFFCKVIVNELWEPTCKR